MNDTVTTPWRSDAGLSGNSVLVTGAAGGIGRAILRGFAEAGCRVLGVDRPGSQVAGVVAGLPGSGHGSVEGDLRDLDTHAALLQRAQDLAAPGGRLVALVHLAAVLHRRASIEDVSESDWDEQAETNLKVTFFLNRASWSHFRECGNGGSIINYTSQGWWTGGYGGSVVYAATKGGVVSLTRGLARTFAPDNVRVNAVAPGGVDTDMFHTGLTQRQNDEFVQQIPLGRVADPEDLVGITLFLASDASSYMTGTTTNISGGQLIY